MPVVECAGCQRKYKVGDDLAGKKVKCRSCGHVMHVPGAAGAIARLSQPAPPAHPAALQPATAASDAPDIDALFSGGADLHFKDDDAPPAAPVPPPIQHNAGHSTAGGRKLALSASTPGNRSTSHLSSVMPSSEATVRLDAPPPPIMAPTGAPATLGYAQPMPSGPMQPVPIARPQYSSVHGQPAVGLDGVSPLLLLLFFVSGIIVMIIMTIQMHNLPDQAKDDAIPTSVIWTGGFAYMGTLFVVLGPLTWLAMFITAKIFSFRLGDVPYLRSCGVAAIPGIVMFISFIMVVSDANPFFLILLGCAVIPLTYLIIRGVFYMSWGAAAVGFVFTSIFQTFGNFVAFFLVVVMMAGSMMGAEKAKREALLAEQQRRRQEEMATITQANRQAMASPARPSAAATPPAPASPVVDLLEQIPDEQMPRVPDRKALLDSAMGLYRWLDNHNNTVEDDYMFRAPQGFVYGMSAPGLMRMVGGGHRDLFNPRGEGYSEANFAIIATMDSTRSPEQVKGKRRTETRDGDRTIVSVFDAFEVRGITYYIAEHYVFSNGRTVKFTMKALEPFSHPLHGAVAMTPLTLTKLDYYAQAKGDLMSADESLQNDALQRLAKRPPTEDREEFIRLARPFIDKEDPHDDALRLVGLLLPREEAAKLVLSRLADEKRRYAATRVAVDVLLAHNDKQQIPNFIEVLRVQPSDELNNVLAAHGKDAHPHLVALLEEDPERYCDRVLTILEKAPSEAILPAMKSLSTSRNRTLRNRARDLANRVKPGTFDDVDVALSELQLAGTFEKEQILEQLARVPVQDKRRAEVSTALLRLIEDTDYNLPESTVPLLIKWHDDQTVPALIAMLGPNADEIERQSAMAVLAGIKDPRGIVPITRWLIKEGRAASAALKAYGPVVEKDIIALLDEKSVTARVNACGILGAVGTEKSLGPLGAMSRSRDAAVAASAQAALDLLKARLGTPTPTTQP
jgi:hypothetical protein